MAEIGVTDEQAAVIAHNEGPALVAAGAGTGKTTVLLLRLRRLVRAGLPPDQALMVTFSRRSVADMRRRASKLRVPFGVSYRTLHSVAFEMIKTAHQQGYVPRVPLIPKDWQVRRIIREELKKIEGEVGRGAMLSMPKPRDVLSEIDRAKACMIWPDTVDPKTGECLIPGEWTSLVDGLTRSSYGSWAVNRHRCRMSPRHAAVVERCYARLEQAGMQPEAHGFERDTGCIWVTFNNMVALVGRAILTGEPWVAGWQGAWPWLLSDECQDNAPVNWVMIEHLAGPYRNLMCVGDDMQSIFGWRGAQPGLMQDFISRRGAQFYELTNNFRSGGTILSAANHVVVHAPQTLGVGLVCGRRTAGSITARGFNDSDDEASEVVHDIESSLRDGADPNEIAVLYRINSLSGPFEMAMIKAGIPYKVAGSSFFRRGEIKAAVGYLACAMDPNDERGLRDCVNAPKRYLGNVFLEKCPTLAVAREVAGAGDAGRWARGIRELSKDVRDVAEMLEDRTLREVLDFIFESLGVREHFREEGSSEEDDTEVDEACAALLTCADTLTRSSFEENEGDEDDQPAPTTISTAETLIRYARDMSGTGLDDVDGEGDATPRVTLSTIHKAKGLEWLKVYVVGAAPGLLPLIKSPKREERRLFYVAITRAKDACHVSWPELNGHGKNVGPSPFVREAGLIPPELSDEVGDGMEALEGDLLPAIVGPEELKHLAADDF